MNTPRSLPPAPPARGSFPLDHHGKCKEVMRAYLSCMKEQGDAHHLCRDQSKSYLSCRMERGLMAQEDLDTMGFGPGSQVVMGKHDSEQEEIIAGLNSARKKSGFLFGLGGGSAKSK